MKKVIEGVRAACEGFQTGVGVARTLFGNEAYMAESFKAWAFLSDEERIEMGRAHAAEVRNRGLMMAQVTLLPEQISFYKKAARAAVRGERLWAGVSPEAVKMAAAIIQSI